MPFCFNWLYKHFPGIFSHKILYTNKSVLINVTYSHKKPPIGTLGGSQDVALGPGIDGDIPDAHSSSNYNTN